MKFAEHERFSRKTFGGPCENHVEDHFADPMETCQETV